MVRTEITTTLNWGAGSPAPGIPANYFVARLSFWLQITETKNYTFYLSSDDHSKFFLNGTYIGNHTSTTGYKMELQPAHHFIQLTYVEWEGNANLNFRWDNGVQPANNPAGIPWFRIFPFAPGMPADISVKVNGAPALHNCPARTHTFDRTDAYAPTPEPLTVSVGAGTCTHVFSSYMTPTLSQALPTGAINTQTAGPTVSFTGSLLGDLEPTNYDITIGGQPCAIVSVVNATTSTATLNYQTITCSWPPLPGKKWPVVIISKGYGATRAFYDPVTSTANTARDLLLTYTMSVYKDANGAIYAPYSAYLGGGLLVVNGAGFVPSDPNQANGMRMTVDLQQLTKIPPGTAVTVVSATTSTMTLRIGRFVNGDIPTATTNIKPTVTIRAFDGAATVTATPPTSFTLTLQGDNSPVVSAASRP